MNKILKTLSVFAMLAIVFLFSSEAFAEVKIAVIDSGSTEQHFKSISFSSIPASEDPISHGTKIAGIIRDYNPGAKLFVLQVCEEENGHYNPSKKSVLNAIRWCMENDIDIVNLSLVIEYNKEIEKAIKQAYLEKGIIFVAAAGNKTAFSQFAVNSDGYVCFNKKDSGPKFPASGDYVISVGAKDIRGRVTGYSTKDVDVFSNGDYAKLEGTSFACARVTGKVSKLLAFKEDISIKDLKLALKK